MNEKYYYKDGKFLVNKKTGKMYHQNGFGDKTYVLNKECRKSTIDELEYLLQCHNRGYKYLINDLSERYKRGELTSKDVEDEKRLFRTKQGIIRDWMEWKKQAKVEDWGNGVNRDLFNENGIIFDKNKGFSYDMLEDEYLILRDLQGNIIDRHYEEDDDDETDYALYKPTSQSLKEIYKNWSY